MKLDGILNISGKPGLFKVISQAKGRVIVESLIDSKRIAIHSNSQANMLQDLVMSLRQYPIQQDLSFLGWSKKMMPN